MLASERMSLLRQESVPLWTFLRWSGRRARGEFLPLKGIHARRRLV
jgi:hypothetical protein